MTFIDMKDYGPSAKLYWWTVIALGGIALAWAVPEVLSLEPAQLLQVLVGVAVAALVGLFPVRIPGRQDGYRAAPRSSSSCSC